MKSSRQAPKQAALITGAAVRVGRGIALRLADAGYDIVLHYHRSEKEAQATAKDVERLGAKCHLLRQDLSELEALPSMVEKAFEAAPGMNALVNCASVFEPKGFLEMEIAEYRRHMAVNLDAPLFLAQAFAKHVQQGSIVNLVDSFARQDKTTFFAYLLAKKGLANATRMMAVALAPHVRVNAIFPGIMLPSGPGYGEDYMATKKEKLPLKKLATVGDVADAVLMLLQQPGWIGQALYLDGGEQLL